MNELEKDVERFIQAIKNSKTYRDYIKYKELIKQDPDLKRQVDEYRKEVYELQNSDSDNEQQLEAITEKYADFVELPNVSDFLDAEVNLCKMLQNITDKVVESVDFE